MARTVRLKARRAAARGVPPQLPRDEVEPLPFFGRTWYVHGVDYWFRRVVMALVALAALGVAVAVEIALLNVASKIGSDVGRWAWRTAWAAQVIASLVRPARAMLAAARLKRAGQLLRPDWPQSAQATGRGSRVGAVARIAAALAGARLVVDVVLSFGWIVMFLIWTLEAEYGVEHDARLRLQRRHRDAAAPGPSTPE